MKGLAVTWIGLVSAVARADESDLCKTAIGFTYEKSNAYCRDRCLEYLKEKPEATFKDFIKTYRDDCHYQIFELRSNGKPVRDECFSNFTIFNTENRPNRYTVTADVDHPVVCQTLCQDARERCYRWQWEWGTKNCYFMTRTQTKYFIKTRTMSLNNPERSDNLCQQSKVKKQCLSCGGMITNSKFSDDSFSGWKWCTNHRDDCRVPQPPRINFYKGTLRGPRGGMRYSFDSKRNVQVFYDEITGQAEEELPADGTINVVLGK